MMCEVDMEATYYLWRERKLISHDDLRYEISHLANWTCSRAINEKQFNWVGNFVKFSSHEKHKIIQSKR